MPWVDHTSNSFDLWLFYIVIYLLIHVSQLCLTVKASFMTCNYICYHKGRNFQFCVQQRLNSDLLSGQLLSNSVFIGKQNPELCQLSFICVYSQHLTLALNHPSHDTTAAPQGLPLSTSPASILMSLLFYSSPTLALWFLSKPHECENSDLVLDGRQLRTLQEYSRWGSQMPRLDQAEARASERTMGQIILNSWGSFVHSISIQDVSLFH